MVLIDNGGAGAAAVQLLPPPDDLAALVEHLWIQPGALTDDWRVVPDASPHLLVTVDRISQNDGPLPVWLIGPRSAAISVNMSRRRWTIGLRLRPGSLHRVIDLPARDLVDRTVAAANALPREVMSGLDISRNSPPEHIARELARLVRRACALRPVDGTLSRLGELERHRRVHRVAEALRWPARTAHARVQRTIGFGPKLVLRIARLHQALRVLGETAGTSASAAHMAGYADQSHFTRDCRDLLGETPRAWRARAAAESFKTVPSRAPYA